MIREGGSPCPWGGVWVRHGRGEGGGRKEGKKGPRLKGGREGDRGKLGVVVVGGGQVIAGKSIFGVIQVFFFVPFCVPALLKKKMYVFSILIFSTQKKME